MPLRPSPLPLKIGIDITDTRRFQKYLVPRVQPLFAFLAKTYTPPEQRRFWARFGQTGYLTKTLVADAAIRFLASRWAAKEAVFKAIPTRKLYHKDVEIYSRASGEPFAIVLDRRRPLSIADTASHVNARHLYRTHLQRTTGNQRADTHNELERVESARIESELADIELDRAIRPTEGTNSDDATASIDYIKLPPVSQPYDDHGDSDNAALPPDTHGMVVNISISHDGVYCIATAIAPTEPFEGDVGGEAAARDPML